MKRCIIIVLVVCLVTVSSAGCSRSNPAVTPTDAVTTSDNKSEDKVSVPDIADSTTYEVATSTTDSNSQAVTTAADLPVNNESGTRPAQTITAAKKQVPTTIMTTTTKSTAKPEPAATSAEITPKTKFNDQWRSPYNLNAIDSDCKSMISGYGLTWNDSLRPDNASWDNQVSTVSFTYYPNLFYLKDNVAELIKDEYDYYNKRINSCRIYFETNPDSAGDYYVYFLFL